MTEASEWKQKYRDSLLEMEVAEKRWRVLEQALRRLVGRLCAAGMGVDQTLDDQLQLVAAANRRNADAAGLEKLADALTSAVVAVDAVSPVPTIVLAPVPPAAPKRWESSCTAAAKILQILQAAGDPDPTLPDLIARASKLQSDAELAAMLDKTADLVRRHSDTVSLERLQAAAVLADVTTRLEEMGGYLTTSGDEAQSHFSDTAAVNDDLLSQVRDLSAEATGATELKTLQSAVTARLTTVTRQVQEFRARGERRLLEHTTRFLHMRTRIADLEREAQELHSRLDREKFGARHDPLTLVANRKAFDERIALATMQRSNGDAPTVVMLWDVDNFKSINDAYGHRAGDRVLKSVAGCLVSGVRPEDFVARIGGEEFVILLDGLTVSQAARVADELRLGVSALQFHFRGAPVRVTASCGLTELRPEDTVNAAFDRVDAALYRAKHGGKNACITA